MKEERDHRGDERYPFRRGPGELENVWMFAEDTDSRSI